MAGGRADLLGEVAGRAHGLEPGVGGQVGADMWPGKDSRQPLPIDPADVTGPIPLDP
jgi:hypothetical protein